VSDRTSTWHAAHAWLGGEDVTADVTIEAVDGVISSVQAGAAPPAGATRLDGLVLPGFANAHSHVFHRALRGRTARGGGSFWSWRDEMYSLAEHLTPDTLRDLATATFAEMLCAGFTAVGEFHYLHHGTDGQRYDDPNATSRCLIDAACAAGLRLTLLDTCYLQSAPGEDVHGVQRRFSDGSAPAWAERLEDLGTLPDSVRVGAAIHSVRAVPPDAMAEVVAWSDRHAAPLHAHVSEQPLENELALAAYGVTPTVLLADRGALSGRFTAVHATHLTTEDRIELARAGAIACVCPTTERALADGLVELGPLRAANVPVALGSDSHAVIDPFEEARCVEGHERLRTLRRGAMSPGQLFDAATSVGHRSVGWSGGSLSVGAPCDLVCVRTDGIALAGGGDDLLAALLAAGTARDVTTVVVGGHLVVEGGAHRTIDVAGRLERAIRAAWT
jgi:formiminoglutamate deiminase